MSLPFVIGYDATHANIAHLPKGQAAGYTTGSPDIKWTAEDWAAHPGAIRYDQDGNASDPTADILDVERGAASPAECGPWSKAAALSYATGKRPGQRMPAIYMSAGNVTTVVNALVAAGHNGGIGLIVANWSISELAAVAEVEAAAGPFPVHGIQFTDSPGFYDIAVYSTAWVNTVSGKPQPPAPAPDPRPLPKPAPVPEPKPAPKPPVRHVTDGRTTPAQLAGSRPETFPALVAFSLAQYTPADTGELLAALTKSRGRLPKGIPWYTVNP
jgi:hypothetical protein